MSTCGHGRSGFCWDAASAEDRDAFEGSYRGAYGFLEQYDRVEAEAFASWFAGVNYVRGYAWAEGVDLRREHEQFRAVMQ